MSMNQDKKITHGDLLYKLMPTVYRARDNGLRDNGLKGNNSEEGSDGDLKKLLDTFGGLLDQISANIDQFYADNFPFSSSLENENEIGCQPWLLPYFADLLDVNLVSPDAKGQAREVANAVRWRQRRGTPVATEEIAQLVGDMEVEIQEGWKRIAVTPSVNTPLMPESGYAENEIESGNPQDIAKHPGLQVATIDTRKYSAAVKIENETANSHYSDFSGQKALWITKNRSSVPLFGCSYQDLTPKTLDIRTPNWKEGHANPRSVILYCPIADGFYKKEVKEISWASVTSNDSIEVTAEKVMIDGSEYKKITYKGKAGNHSETNIAVKGKVKLKEDTIYDFENLVFSGEIETKKSNLTFKNCAVNEINIVSQLSDKIPTLDAQDSLFSEVFLKTGKARFEYCTVLKSAVTPEIEASDSIFSGVLKKDKSNAIRKINGGIRYSCVPESSEKVLPKMIYKCTKSEPLFFTSFLMEKGAGVIHPAASSEIKHGAENGGEMGAHHIRMYCLRYEAVIAKIKENLPVGLNVALVPDQTLASVPPGV